jgi:hypothetical protein
LPNVSAELQALHTLLGSETLVDKEFVAANLEKKLKDEQFTIVHVARTENSETRSIKPSSSLSTTSCRWTA